MDLTDRTDCARGRCVVGTRPSLGRRPGDRRLPGRDLVAARPPRRDGDRAAARSGTDVVVLEGDATMPGTGSDRGRGAGGAHRYPRAQRRRSSPVDPTTTDAGGWTRAFQLLSITPIELGHGAPPGHARSGLGPGRRDPVIGRSPTDHGPRLFERRARRADGLAQDDGQGRRHRRRDRQPRLAVDSRRLGSTSSTGTGRDRRVSRSTRSGPPTWPRSRPAATDAPTSSRPTWPTSAPSRPATRRARSRPSTAG